MPPFFSTSQFTEDVAVEIEKAGQPWGSKKDPYAGSDYAVYSISRFDGGPRQLGIPHPYPYVKLVNCIEKHWPIIEAKIASEPSEISLETTAMAE